MTKRWLTMTSALLGAATFAMSVQGAAWWTIGDYEIAPFGAKHCLDDQCTPARMSWLGAGAQFERIGMATWAAALIAAAVLVVMSARVAAKHTPRLAAKTALVALATAVLAGTAFVVKFPGEFPSAAARGLYLYPVACVLGLVSAVTVLRARATQPIGS